MMTGIPESSLLDSTEDSFSWEWEGVFQVVPNEVYAFEARGNLSLGRDPGRGHLYNRPTREDNISELLDAWIYVPRFTGQMDVKEDNEPNRQAVVEFMEPVFKNLQARREGKPHSVVHEGVYSSSAETRWFLADGEKMVPDGLFRSRSFAPKTLMAWAKASVIDGVLSASGSVWTWGNGRGTSWQPDDGSREWRFSVSSDSAEVVLRQGDSGIPDHLLCYAQYAIDRAIELQLDRDQFLV